MSKRVSHRERISQTLQRTSASTVTSDFTQLAGDLQEVAVSLIELRTRQPRRQFDEEAFRNLQESIKAQGVMQPIIVHQNESGGFELVAGERRWRAAKGAGLQTIPARVLTGYAANQLDFIAAMENLQREDLNPVDEADAILNVLANELATPRAGLPALLSRLRRVDRSRHNVMSRGKSLEEVDLQTIKKVEVVFSQLAAGNWQSFVANKMGVLKLPEDLLEAVRGGELEYTKAIALRKVKDEKTRELLLRSTKETSLDELRKLIQEKASQPQGESATFAAYLNSTARKRLEALPQKEQRRAVKLLRQLEDLLASKQS